MSDDLRRAIKLREWTRRAIDINDIPGMCELNRRADVACAKLSGADMEAYRIWVFAGVDMEAMFKDIFGTTKKPRRKKRKARQ